MIEPGTRFDRLVVIELAEKRRRPSRPTKGWYFLYRCRCDCGTIKVIEESSLKNKHARSCGCLKKELYGTQSKTHGMWTTKTWKAWSSMKDRCSIRDHRDQKYYGGKGIKVCDRWKNSFENFLEDMGERPDGYSLDRIDPDGDYTPENCRWASAKKQANNRTNNRIVEFNNERKTLSEWADSVGLKYTTLRARLSNGWGIEKALTTKLSLKHSHVRN